MHHPFIVVLAAIIVRSLSAQLETAVWRWECERGHCQKRRVTDDTRATAMSLQACRLFCTSGAALWPLPTGRVDVGNVLIRIDADAITTIALYNNSNATIDPESPVSKLWRRAFDRFKSNLLTDAYGLKRRSLEAKKPSETTSLALGVNVHLDDASIVRYSLGANESYALTINRDDDDDAAKRSERLLVTIRARSFLGARHALETLGQLIIYDDLRDELQVPRDVAVSDAPAYTYRGLLLDTARNYVDVETILRTLDAMSASKLNVFHWHMTDTQSFPYHSKSRPELTRLGAYDARKVYTDADVRQIVDEGRVRGIKVLPEFDAPAHVGEGWQDSDLVVCFDHKPWQDYCVEPPCGQFDPTKEKLYDYLEDLYGDICDQFDPDLFHMGGDEVSYKCWNSSDAITAYMRANGMGNLTDDDFVTLWTKFQREALRRFDKRRGHDRSPIVLWTSTLTKSPRVADHLPRDRYVIQVWTTGDDPHVRDLLDKGYRLIMSNYDALYFDCGFAGWVADGHNWCAPYIGWQKVYENSPARLLLPHGGAGEESKRKEQLLGAEATLWTEQSDTSNIDSRLWPRAAAMAERLWTEPLTTTWKEAEQRFLVHRERLVARGIAADSIEPLWCLQNEGRCPLDGAFNQLRN